MNCSFQMLDYYFIIFSCDFKIFGIITTGLYMKNPYTKCIFLSFLIFFPTSSLLLNVIKTVEIIKIVIIHIGILLMIKRSIHYIQIFFFKSFLVNTFVFFNSEYSLQTLTILLWKFQFKIHLICQSKGLSISF